MSRWDSMVTSAKPQETVDPNGFFATPRGDYIHVFPIRTHGVSIGTPWGSVIPR